MDMVEIDKPDHYAANLADGGRIECWDLICALDLNPATANVLKYIWRAGKKQGNSYKQDLMKAKKYIELEIERIDSENHRIQKEINETHSQAFKNLAESEKDEKIVNVVYDGRVIGAIDISHYRERYVRFYVESSDRPDFGADSICQDKISTDQRFCDTFARMGARDPCEEPKVKKDHDVMDMVGI